MNYIIVISDGEWQNHSGVKNITNQIRLQLGIKTFAVGFALGTTKTTYSDLAVAGGTTKPLYAENEAELLQKLTDAIKQALSGRLTFTTPAVMSDASKDDYIYQSTSKGRGDITEAISLEYKRKLLELLPYDPFPIEIDFLPYE